MKNHFFLCMALLITFGVNAAVLNTKDGKNYSSNSLSFFNGAFRVGNITLNRNNVSKVFFARTEKAKKNKNSIAIDGHHTDGKFVFSLNKPLEKPCSISKDASFLQKKYPDAEQIVVRDCGKNQLFPNGERSYSYHRAVKILKESALMNNLRFYWGEDRDNTKLYMVRVIQPDGKVEYASNSDITVNKSKSSGADFISQGKVINISLPDVKIGSIIEYIYESYTFNPYNKDFFFPSYGFEDNYPVKKSSFEVIIPSNKELFWAAKNMGKQGEPKQWEENGVKHFYWEVLDSAPIVNEPAMPAYYDIAKTVRCSIFKDWKKFWAWERSQTEDKMKLTPFLANEVDKITKGAVSKEEKLAKIYHWMQKNIRYISIKSGIGSGWSGHPAEMTYKNKFGDCIDKAILMSTMLKHCGIEAYPIGIMTKPGATMEKRVPNMNCNHAITVVYLNGVRMTLDSTASTYRYPSFRSDDHGVWADNYFKDELYKIKLSNPKNNCYSRYQIIKVDKNNNATVYYRTSYTGSFEAGARRYWMYKRKDAWKDELRNMVNNINPGSTLISYKINNVFDISKPFSRELYWKAPDIFSKAGKYVIVDFKDRARFSSTSLKKRKYPILYEDANMEKLQYVVLIPDNLKVKYLPDNIHLKNKHGYFIQEYKRTPNGFTALTEYAITSDFIPVSDYQEYREFTKKIEDYYQRVVFLESVN